jgi:hypothetical protein
LLDRLPLTTGAQFFRIRTGGALDGTSSLSLDDQQQISSASDASRFTLNRRPHRSGPKSNRDSDCIADKGVAKSVAV